MGTSIFPKQEIVKQRYFFLRSFNTVGLVSIQFKTSSPSSLAKADRGIMWGKGKLNRLSVPIHQKHPIITVTAYLIQIWFSLNRRIVEANNFLALWAKKVNNPTAHTPGSWFSTSNTWKLLVHLYQSWVYHLTIGNCAGRLQCRDKQSWVLHEFIVSYTERWENTKLSSWKAPC